MTDSPPEPCSATLQQALQRREVDLAEGQQVRIDDFCRALWCWNQRLNLTRHTTYDLFVARDLVDSLQLAHQLRPQERVLDVGSGGGVPGLLVHLLRPDLEVTVCDSVAKKAHAMGQIAAELDLRVTVVHARAERLLQTSRFDSLTARAVGPLAKLLRWFEPCWDAFGRLLLVKGPRWVAERGEARHLGLLKGLELRRLAQYRAPGAEWESVILSIRRAPPPGAV